MSVVLNDHWKGFQHGVRSQVASDANPLVRNVPPEIPEAIHIRNIAEANKPLRADRKSHGYASPRSRQVSLAGPCV